MARNFRDLRERMSSEARHESDREYKRLVREMHLGQLRAARELKATWSEWTGLPGSEKLNQYVRQSPVDHDRRA